MYVFPEMMGFVPEAGAMIEVAAEDILFEDLKMRSLNFSIFDQGRIICLKKG